MTKPEKATTSARDAVARVADAGVSQAHAAGPLVINLCSSNTPMSLLRPDAPELARYTFFVSRRREEGRERFRLHMGYFESRADADQLLTVVREVYPAAWVGEAPGQALRPEARKALSAPPTAAPAPSPTRPDAARTAPVTTPRATAPAPAATAAAPTAATATVAKPTVAAPVARIVLPPRTPVSPTTPRPPAAAAPAPRAASAPVISSASVLSPSPSLVSVVRSVVGSPAGAAHSAKPAMPSSNVREVLAQLDSAKPLVAKPAMPTMPAIPATPAPAPAAAIPTRAELEFELMAGGTEQTDSQVLRVLESRVAPNARLPATRQADDALRDIPVHRPQDTMSWREIRDELKREAEVSFALQLVWSPNPVDPKTVPALAIFDAYTLYNVEVGRTGQKQYGLRLGFFTDAMSAKQVATYVRSEFLAVAVVPVTMGERDTAQRAGGIHLARPPAPAGTSLQAEEITLINELTPARNRTPGMALKQIDIASLANKPAALTAGAKPASKPARPSRPRGSGPRTLEETLEILGASQLSIDNGRGERLNMGSRSRQGPDKRTSTFSKLLDRLSTRLKP